VKPFRPSQLHDCLLLVTGGVGDPRPTLITRRTIAEERRRRTRILVAEDGEVDRLVAVGILERLGYTAETFTNGREAVEALRKSDFDLVFMDCEMPVMDGYEATKAIRGGRAAVRDPDVPVVAMTASAMKGDREACLAAGMDDYLAKPARPDDVALVLEKNLRT